tara:strand:+ start:2006 stop:2191 length:186 start_codon:yes stop_codon:yes gene_type:complete
MTLPQNGKKLTESEAKSIESAVEETGIQAIHPERMEALAELMVSKLKGSGTHWRTDNPMDY